MTKVPQMEKNKVYCLFYGKIPAAHTLWAAFALSYIPVTRTA